MDVLVVPPGRFAIEDPWRVPPECAAAPLVRATDGSAARLGTTVAAYWDEIAMTVLFEGADDLVVATYLAHDEPLWEQDVVEIFVAPRALTEYFEIEVNPLGTTFDARLESPDGDRRTMRTFVDWDIAGLFAAIRTDHRDGRLHVCTTVRIPFAAFGARPRSGDTWRANFFRIDRNPFHGDEYLAWQPGRKDPPDFHLPAAFGTLSFL